MAKKQISTMSATIRATSEAEAAAQADDQPDLPDWLVGVDLSPGMGDCGDFTKTTISFPPEIFHALKILAAYRSVDTGKAVTVSHMAREAIAEMFRSRRWEMPKDWRPKKAK